MIYLQALKLQIQGLLLARVSSQVLGEAVAMCSNVFTWAICFCKICKSKIFYNNINNKLDATITVY